MDSGDSMAASSSSHSPYYIQNRLHRPRPRSVTFRLSPSSRRLSEPPARHRRPRPCKRLRVPNGARPPLPPRRGLAARVRAAAPPAPEGAARTSRPGRSGAGPTSTSLMGRVSRRPHRPPPPWSSCPPPPAPRSGGAGRPVRQDAAVGLTWMSQLRKCPSHDKAQGQSASSQHQGLSPQQPFIRMQAPLV